MPSLYVHVPFCLKKCDYCAFYSMNINDAHSLCYLQGMEREIQMRHKEAPSGVSSLFLGGGTPTALSNRDLNKLLNLIHTHYVFDSITKGGTRIDAQLETETPLLKSPRLEHRVIEKTTEANPGTLDSDILKTLTNYGINRVSLGAQCFNDKQLRYIGRIHNASDIRRGVELIRKAGINNLNLDLMFGLPGQTIEDWQNTLSQAVELEPEHLSVYGLTIEEGTPLARRISAQETQQANETQPVTGTQITSEVNGFSSIRNDLPDDDLQADMAEWTAEYLHDRGFRHYEISNYAKPGYECRHNLSYWEGSDYIGLGPGAVSCINGTRTRNVEDVALYKNLLADGRTPHDPNETENLTLNQRISEYAMLKFRTADGIRIETFSQWFNINFQDIYGHILANYIDRNILILDQGSIRINPQYFFIANSILKDFII